MTAGAPDRVRTLDWHEPGVTLPEVLAQLTRMAAELAGVDREGPEDAHPHPRNCVMNLVAVVPDAAAARQVQDVGSALSSQHPLRLLCLELEPAHNTARMDAWISTEAHHLPGGQPVQAELVRLRVTGGTAEDADTLVEPLLVPDVPVFLWWLGSPPVGHPGFDSLVRLAGVLIVDSATFERPFLTTLELAEAAAAGGEGLQVADLQWGRLRGWRELLAQLFTPPPRRPFLRGIGGVGIDYAGEGRGNRVPAALLTGWLASRLGWKLTRAVGGAGGTVVAQYESGGHAVEVQYRSVEAAHLGEGEVAAVRIEAGGGGATLHLELERRGDEPGRVRTRLELGESAPLEESRPMEARSPAQLLVELASQPRDRVYAASLESAAELLRALR